MIVWLKPEHTRGGLGIERLRVKVICQDGPWATVELEDGSRRAAPVSQLKEVKDCSL